MCLPVLFYSCEETVRRRGRRLKLDSMYFFSLSVYINRRLSATIDGFGECGGGGGWTALTWNSCFGLKNVFPTPHIRGREKGRDGRMDIRQTEREDRKQTRDEVGRTGENGVRWELSWRERSGEGRGGVGEAPLFLIRRNAELGNVYDFSGQTPPGARRGHVCFYPRRPSLQSVSGFAGGSLAVFMLVSPFHQTFFGGTLKRSFFWENARSRRAALEKI